MNLLGAGRGEGALEFLKWRPPWISVALLYLFRTLALTAAGNVIGNVERNVTL